METYTEEDPEGAMSVVSVETSDDGTTRRTETTVSWDLSEVWAEGGGRPLACIKGKGWAVHWGGGRARICSEGVKKCSPARRGREKRYEKT